jgi:hypothetical protein
MRGGVTHGVVIPQRREPVSNGCPVSIDAYREDRMMWNNRTAGLTGLACGGFASRRVPTHVEPARLAQA